MAKGSRSGNGAHTSNRRTGATAALGRVRSKLPLFESCSLEIEAGAASVGTTHAQAHRFFVPPEEQAGDVVGGHVCGKRAPVHRLEDVAHLQAGSGRGSAWHDAHDLNLAQLGRRNAGVAQRHTNPSIVAIRCVLGACLS